MRVLDPWVPMIAGQYMLKRYRRQRFFVGFLAATRNPHFML